MLRRKIYCNKNCTLFKIANILQIFTIFAHKKLSSPVSGYSSRLFCLIHVFLQTTLYFLANGIVLSDVRKIRYNDKKQCKSLAGFGSAKPSALRAPLLFSLINTQNKALRVLRPSLHVRLMFMYGENLRKIPEGYSVALSV
jgi:hypothetical protein